MEQSPSREAISSLDSSEILHILWNPKVHYRFYESLSLLPYLELDQSNVRCLVFIFKVYFSIIQSWHCASSGCGCKRPPVDMEGSYEYIE